MTLFTICILLIFHFIADFMLQTDKMAINKSSSNYWLTKHVAVYSLLFTLIHPIYALVNGFLHWITDYVTSRLAAKAWQTEKRSLFFTIIGLDQLIHTVTLISTYYFMVHHYEYIIPWIF